MHLTAKQGELLRVIAAGNGENDPADLDEILERVRYETTKQSLQFSIRAMIKHGLIAKRGVEKRRGRMRQVLFATELGIHYNGYTGAAAVDFST
jgi:predicted transcriptional regulator